MSWHRPSGTFLRDSATDEEGAAPDAIAARLLLRTFWPSADTKLTIAHMAQDVSLAGLPDEYTEFSSDPETLEVRGWAYDDGSADGGVEVVDDAYFDGAFDDAVDEPPAIDPFATFGAILERAACTVGGDAVDPRALRVLLGLERDANAGFGALAESAVRALIDGGILQRDDTGLARTPRFATMVDAWSGILRGESEDFAPCGTQMLDEWAADLVARFLGSAARGASVRREVRSFGVAAFGLVASAA
jgi:hypothetical protein